MPVLTAVDLIGIQRYVFLSNRLKDAVGASWQVHWACSDEEGHALLKALDGSGDLLIAAGGNALLRFENKDKARLFAARYTRLLIEKAPGLEAVIDHHAYVAGKLAAAVKDAPNRLARAKQARKPLAPPFSLGVNATCRETGLPAECIDDGSPLSRNVRAMREHRGDAQKRMAELLLGENSDRYAFPLELDELGREEGERSLLGVVHIDGNGVGNRIGEFIKARLDETDESFLEEFQALSGSLDRLATAAMKSIVGRLIAKVTFPDGLPVLGGFPEARSFSLQQFDDAGKKKTYLPLRPILMGGDDLTFVCDGRIALDATAAALAVFGTEKVAHLGEITACAGVTVVKSHSPFSKAYDLAEELCGSAKAWRRNENATESALDWHFGLTSSGHTIHEHRKRYLQEDKLTCKPYPLSKSAKKAVHWGWLDGELLGRGDESLRGAAWGARHNKAKKLADIVRDGKSAVESSLKAWQNVDSDLKLPAAIAKDGYCGSATPLLDALELLDIHLSLDPSQEKVKQDA